MDVNLYWYYSVTELLGQKTDRFYVQEVFFKQDLLDTCFNLREN